MRGVNMEIEYKLKKIFHRIKEGEGMVDSIISYNKHPVEFRQADCGNGKAEIEVAKWMHHLLLDLYFVRIKFKWVKDENIFTKKSKR